MNKPEGEHIDREGLARFIAGECTDDERVVIQAWIDARPSRAKLVASLREVWKLSASQKAWDVDGAWSDHLARRRAQSAAASDAPRPLVPAAARRNAAWAWPVRVAAVLVVLAGGAVVWNRIAPSGNAVSPEARLFSTGIAEQKDVLLPDGSVVTLAPLTRLHLAADFGASARAVHIEGQAVFQVTHDAKRPFRVNTAAAVTEVLGTRFVVRAYADDPQITVALVEGSIRVQAPDPAAASDALTLRPGQVAHAAVGSAPRVDGATNASAFTAWTEGQLVFKDAPLTEVARELRRWYNIEITLADSVIAKRRLTASFARAPAPDVLALVALSLNLRYQRAGSAFVLSVR